ncbi:L,D-transpeptidase [Oryzibacter oryziterrae]|uniref:L,D-transpeptidase n=1 Tax=Oryzibacter oryziterrae TaxID=2766474 RepID=UPI0028BE1BEB|nr:L,D-transpeptidase [Oryzibacter oryziterrae]
MPIAKPIASGEPGIRRYPLPSAQFVSMYGEVEDGGFVVPAADLTLINPAFLRQEVDYPTDEAVGTLIVDTPNRYLYLVMEGGRALRYGVGVGREGFTWNGRAVIRRKAQWPSWHPPVEMQARDPKAALWANGMPGGPDNPLGARAHYLYQGKVDTLYRIHGTSQPWTIGTNVSSGCIRLINQDVMHLYERVPVGTEVLVLPADGGATAGA